MIVTTSARVRPGRVLALGGLSSFGPLSLDMYLPALPSVAADLGTTVPVTQLSLSACMLGLALGQLLAGPVTDRFGRRRLLVVGVALFAGTSALCALAPAIEVLLVLRLLGGLGGGAGIVVARSMARDLYHGPTLARVYARLMLVSGIAPVVAPVLGGQVLRFTDWRGLFAVLAGIGLLLVVTALTQRETLPPDRRHAAGLRQTARVMACLLRDRTFLPPTLVLGLGLCAMFTYIAMASFVLQEVYGLDPQSFALVSAGNALGIVVFSQTSAALVRQVGAAKLLSAGVGLALVASAAMLLAVLASDSVVALLLPLFVLVGCTGLIAPNATALALDGQGELAGSASAVLGLAHFGFAAVVPPLASVHGVSPVLMAVTAVTTASAAAIVHVLAVRPRSVGAAAPAAVAGAEASLSVPLAGYAPFGVGSARPVPVPVSVPQLGGGAPGEQTSPRWRRLQWVPVVEPSDDPGAPHGWQQPVGPAAPPTRPGAGADPHQQHVLEQSRLELNQRREWRRIAELARRARLEAELEDADRLGTADTDPGRG